MDDLTKTLQERGGRYGPFDGHANATQEIKRVIHPRLKPKLAGLIENGAITRAEADAIVESLDMIAHKIGRIVNGDPMYADSWHDIVGYATLVEKIIVNKEEKA